MLSTAFQHHLPGQHYQRGSPLDPWTVQMSLYHPKRRRTILDRLICSSSMPISESSGGIRLADLLLSGFEFRPG